MQLLARVRAGACAQHQVEDILGVNGQAADLGARDVHGPRDGAGLAAVAEEGERAQRGGRESDGVPFEDDGGLCGVAAAQDGRRRGVQTIGVGDGGLQVEESGLRGSFRGVVTRDSDVDDAAGGDGRGEEDGGEFDLEGGISVGIAGMNGLVEDWVLTSLLSSVSSTATPASTLPTVREINMVS